MAWKPCSMAILAQMPSYTPGAWTQTPSCDKSFRSLVEGFMYPSAPFLLKSAMLLVISYAGAEAARRTADLLIMRLAGLGVRQRCRPGFAESESPLLNSVKVNLCSSSSAPLPLGCSGLIAVKAGNRTGNGAARRRGETAQDAGGGRVGSNPLRTALFNMSHRPRSGMSGCAFQPALQESWPEVRGSRRRSYIQSTAYIASH